MKKIRSLFIVFFLLAVSNSLLAYTRSQHVDEITWKKLTPFFLPEDHPIKSNLDALFAKRILLNSQTLEAAGFESPLPREFTHTVVSKHPQLKGYIVKLFTDDYPKSEVKDLHDRIIGAIIAKELIEKHGYNALFKVPKKWIYPLPETDVPQGYYRKNFILIAEDMKVVSKKENNKKWKTVVTPEMLVALYNIVQEGGLDDSVLTCNAAFNSKNKICLLDTGVYHRWPIRFHMLLKSLSPSMQIHWLRLIDKSKERTR